MKAPGHSGSCGVGFVCNIKGTKSHDIVRWGIEAVRNLTHRGAVGADGKTGDGAGVLTQIPRKFFLREIQEKKIGLSHADNLAIGFFFIRADDETLVPFIEACLGKSGFVPLFWRDVPVSDDALGSSALAAKPVIRQLLIDAVSVEPGKREQRLYLARRTIERKFREKIYIPSLSSKVIVYKGMLVAPQLDRFYQDLTSPDFESSFCVFHQRFSTNTFPDWTMAQPLRVLAHNGEINTVQGNRNWMSSLEHSIGGKIFTEDERELLRPLILGDESDSASLDRIVELLILSGFSPEHAISMCVPPAWEDSAMEADEKAFFEYASLLMKPWDGPAAIVLTDGEKVCAHLDRNGLRPLRYSLTNDDHMILGSETGMSRLDGKPVKEKGRLGPGETLSIDTTRGVLKCSEEVLRELAARRPYKEWLDKYLFRLKEENAGAPESGPDILRRQIAFGYTSEEIQTSLREMAEKAKEMTWSMGDDTPLPPLSERPQLLFRYFKQRFSQVTNPPIDPIRERMVMSLRMAPGHKKDFLSEDPENAKRLLLDSPVLSRAHINGILRQERLKTVRVDMTYAKAGIEHVSDNSEDTPLPCCAPGRESLLLLAVRRLQRKVLEAVRNGAEIVVLSDRDISGKRPAISSLLAVSASFKALQRNRLADRASIIMETGEARDIHHIACLIGYGASAVHPWLAFLTLKDMHERGDLKVPYEQAERNYRKALEDGLLKVAARMGISTVNSYHGAQLFDSVCLNREFVEEFFTATPVTIEADGLEEIEQSLLKRHSAGFETTEPSLDFGGDLRHRKAGEWHAWSTSAVVALNRFIKGEDGALYKDFSRSADERPVYIRHLLDYKKDRHIPVEEVEPEELILKRFVSGAMSVGALSPEAHETIAEACNILCIRSNSGEGGEDPARCWTVRNSAIKQVASGRFGVTPVYLASASELEIKIAQGAKPGEGGHLPANKVNDYIAKLRHCSPDILLISPPPHHDIYSIEDLSQLINDLKSANPKAKVCVKLVSETGVGAVAAGVAKAYADIVQISGCDGGTGASPITSIRNAGGYWETGLAETQRVLRENGLRERIRIRVDGGLRTGRDIIIAAILGAEEFGFGTATMISAGCVMARQCHTNTCPTGIATQDERLRAKFRGKAEGVTKYFTALAREVRELMAAMGVRELDEIIGRQDLLTGIFHDTHPASRRFRLDYLFGGIQGARPRKCGTDRNDNPAASMNDRLLEELLPHIEKAAPVSREYSIRNVDRSIPLKLSYHISLRYKTEGLPRDTLQLTFRGTAGQSFGAFNHRGVSLTLIGDANDYVGKGMFGGRIVLRPEVMSDPQDHVIMGNTVLYGATGGELYASGRAGERFAVRNSGAAAVVEGAGHHLCEYMTRGVVVVLGKAGLNIGAGMTGGAVYLFDEKNLVTEQLNKAYVKASPLEDEADIERLKALIQNHYHHTGSPAAEVILQDFGKLISNFKKVVPIA